MKGLNSQYNNISRTQNLQWQREERWGWWSPEEVSCFTTILGCISYKYFIGLTSQGSKIFHWVGAKGIIGIKATVDDENTWVDRVEAVV